MEMRTLGQTGIKVSLLGLGTVKIGRNQQVKYPTGFELPDDRQVDELLHLARELGINLIDTAPAYGSSQRRLGKLLPGPRSDWVIVSKVGEAFVDGQSRFDFSHQGALNSIHASLKQLRTDYIDVVLIHSDGQDLRILEQEGVFDALEQLKQQGVIRAHGMSSKTVAGGLRVVESMDVVMATANLQYDDERPVLELAQQLNKGVLIKKGLMSGHVDGQQGVAASFRHLLTLPGVSSIIVGTINPKHLAENARLLEQTLT